jgi:hypothetical protein
MRVIPRRLYNRVLLDELDINISERNNIIRLMSLTHNQLSSEVFHRMIQYPWYTSGYTENHQGSFKTVSEVCFSFDATICAMSSCDVWVHSFAAAGVPNHYVSIIFFLNYHFH